MAVRLDVKTANALVSDDVIRTLEMFHYTTDPDLRVIENFTGMHGKKIGGAMMDLRGLRQRAKQKFEIGQEIHRHRADAENQSSAHPQ